MYYIVETKYVGPNQSQDQYMDVDTIEIRNEPACGNMDHNPIIDGWCGTTNDWAVYAHGEHATIEEARAAIGEIFGEVRDSDPDGSVYESDDERVVETYKPGRYAPMGREATALWADDGIQDDVDADTTDERMDELVGEYEAAANADGYTLDAEALYDSMRLRRQELRDELDAEA